MKKPEKHSPKCIFCNSHPTIKKGTRKNKHRITQKYQCKNCKKHFTIQPSLQKHKTYLINIILNTITNLNLGYSLKQTKNYYKKYKIKKSTLSYWYNQLKHTLPYHRIRNNIKANYKPTGIIKKKTFIHHNQPFLYQYHKPKLDLFLKSYPKLRHYLENIEKILPKGIFKNSQRISRIIIKNKINPNLIIKQNYATKLANIAQQITKDNKKRHQIIENLMLKNDTATIAVEIPIFLKQNETKLNKPITGHIDILQIRYKHLYILDFKPETTNKKQTITQLKLYREALSRRTSINKFKLAFFNDKGYYEIKTFK